MNTEHCFLELLNITKKFPGVKALDNVNLRVKKGEIMGLLGENGAGKSTLMNILGGVIPKDSGKIIIDGKEFKFKNPSEAREEGIGFIHQELSLFPLMSVEENMFITSFPSKGHLPLINKREMNNKARLAIEKLGINISPKALIKDLGIGERQLVEIASEVISKEAEIVIFDEPTSSLSQKERDKLFDIINMLSKNNKSIVYISHDIEEAIEICDRINILRNGKNAGELNADEANKDKVVQLMVGSEVSKTIPKTKIKKGNPVLSVNKLTREDKKIQDISFKALKSEILGIYGLMGSGRTELVRAIFGLDKLIKGEIKINGTKLKRITPQAVKEAGVGFVTEDRREEGLLLNMNIKNNISITSFKKICGGLTQQISRRKETTIAKQIAKRLKIKYSSLEQKVKNLSGGNQQKVIIGKWLHLAPSLFILDEPTKGIDVGAKEEIYKIISELVTNGRTVIFISSDIDEIIGLSDRVLVISNGRITGELSEDEITKEKILSYAME